MVPGLLNCNARLWLGHHTGEDRRCKSKGGRLAAASCNQFRRVEGA
jgi:hypothetical protein